MSEDPGTGFGVTRQGMLDLADSMEHGGAGSLADAFPAALVAPTWRALLEGGVIEAPTRVALDRVEVRVIGPKVLELRVPVRTRNAEFVKAVPVWVEAWTTTGSLGEQLDKEAKRLTAALEQADAQPVVDHDPGSGQKPHN
jgi:hypothetical protein